MPLAGRAALPGLEPRGVHPRARARAGYREATRLSSSLASVIFHDVDLLPSAGLLPLYSAPPTWGKPRHLAGPSTWGKYALPGYDAIFFGGVTAFSPPDFERCNGFPNDHWGWGMEDDQLRLRAVASGAIAGGVERPPEGCGTYRDLDGVAMLRVLGSPQLLATQSHLYNARFLDRRGAPPQLEPHWCERNGLRGLRSSVTSRTQRRLSEHVMLVELAVELGD